MTGMNLKPGQGRPAARWIHWLAAAGGSAVILLFVAGLAAISGLDAQAGAAVDMPALARGFASELALLPFGVAGVLRRAFEPSLIGVVQLAVMAMMVVVSLRAARFGLVYLAEGAYPATLASLAAPPMLLILLMAII